MSDETCCGACGYPIHATKESACDWCRQSADRIEALTAERDDHWKSVVHWRKEADVLTEQLEAARADAKEAEAYAEELERDLKTCRMAQGVMDNTVAELELKSEWFEEEWVSAVDKLNKAVELLTLCRDMFDKVAHPSDPLSKMLNDTLAELGETK